MHTAHCKNNKCSSSFMESCDGMDNFHHCKKNMGKISNSGKAKQRFGGS